MWLRARNNDVQYTLKAYTLIFAWVRVEVFFFQENQGKGNKQDLLTWITLSWLACYKTGCLWCQWKFQNKVFFWRQAGLLNEISVQAATASQDLWKRPSPPSYKNTLQILWGNKAWAERLSQAVKWARAANQAGSPHWHFFDILMEYHPISHTVMTSKICIPVKSKCNVNFFSPESLYHVYNIKTT